MPFWISDHRRKRPVVTLSERHSHQTPRSGARRNLRPCDSIRYQSEIWTFCGLTPPPCETALPERCLEPHVRLRSAQRSEEGSDRGASDRPAKAGRFCFTHAAVSGRAAVLAAGRAKSRQDWGLCRMVASQPARPRSRFGAGHRAGDENPVGSGRPVVQTSQTL
jgi:hypothetical protein